MTKFQSLDIEIGIPQVNTVGKHIIDYPDPTNSTAHSVRFGVWLKFLDFLPRLSLINMISLQTYAQRNAFQSFYGGFGQNTGFSSVPCFKTFFFSVGRKYIRSTAQRGCPPLIYVVRPCKIGGPNLIASCALVVEGGLLLAR